MLRRLIIFLVRRKLGVKVYEEFRFTNQRTEDVYYFSHTKLLKHVIVKGGILSELVTVSKVSLNWILSDDCEIEKIYN